MPRAALPVGHYVVGGIGGANAEVHALGRGRTDVTAPATATAPMPDASVVRALERAGRPFRWRLGRVDARGTAALAAARRAWSAERTWLGEEGMVRALPESTALRVRQVDNGKGRWVLLGPGAHVARCLLPSRTDAWTLPEHTASTPAGRTRTHVVLPVTTSAHALATWMHRGVALAGAGAVLSACFPPSLRPAAQSLVSTLGLQADVPQREHTVVLLPGLLEWPERMDHLVARVPRGARPGLPPMSTDPPEPPPGTPTRDAHATHDVQPGTGAVLELDDAVAAARAALEWLGVSWNATLVRGDSYAHWYAAFPGGGHLVMVHHAATGHVALDLLPAHEPLVHALVAALASRVRASGRPGARRSVRR